MRRPFEVNLFPRPYGVAAYAIGIEGQIERLLLPEDRIITFRGSSWDGLLARRIGGFRSVGEAAKWCRLHGYPRPCSPCLPLIVGETVIKGTEPDAIPLPWES